MRTRFLTPDYFSSSSTTKNPTLPEFLRLPLSPLPSPPPLHSLSSSPLPFLTSTPLSLLNDNELLNINSSLPFHSALSSFLSLVLPQPFPNPLEGGDLSFEESGSKRKNSGHDIIYQSNNVEERAKDGTGDTKQNGTALVQFETPELSQDLENACLCEKERIQLLSEVQECDEKLETLDLPSVPYGCTMEGFLDPVEAIYLGSDTEQKPQILEEVMNNSRSIDKKFPLLEVDEIEIVDCTSLSLEDELHFLLGNTELQHCTYHDDLELSCKDILFSAKIDVVEHISDNHTSQLTLDCSQESLNLPQDIDILQVLESSHIERKMGSGNDSIAPLAETLLFEEFELLDLESVDLFETESILHAVKEPEPCDQLFQSDMNFKSFDELIVNCQLNIIDDSFKSLPVPALKDDENFLALHDVIVNILTQLKPVPLSTSDEIYLDWHLLGKDNCNGDIHAAVEIVFKDTADFTIISNLIPDDGSVLGFDLSLLDDPPDQLNTMDNELLMSSGENHISKQQCDGVASSMLLDDDCQIIEKGGLVINADTDKVALGSESDDDCQIIETGVSRATCDFGKVVSSVGAAPPINDLDFFLNPKKAAGSMGIDRSFKKSGDCGEPLNLGSTMEKGILASTKPAAGSNPCSMSVPPPRMPQEPVLIQPNDLAYPSKIIIINTQSSDKEMIISRRSTYQKILSMEKQGIQVAERDLVLPVDVIVDATMCIVWYDSNNIGKKATSQDEGFSDVSLCMENIAANVLTSLSFMFTSCVLIFEGENTFLNTVMELADEIYAAAASLGVNIQIFCSYSFELTDEIILNFIGKSIELSGNILPRLPESETLAESFLVKFPSINPLTAHAIISCGFTLSEFLKLSSERRINALRKYCVPDESVDLLSVLCKYGEREEAKSGVTDCSSSVSSPPEAENIIYKLNSEDRKRKFIPTFAEAMYDHSGMMPTKEHDKDVWNHPSSSRSLPPMVSKSPKICPDGKRTDHLLDNELFNQGDAPNTGSDMGVEGWLKSDFSRTPGILQMDDELLLSDKFFSQQKSDIARRNKRKGYDEDLFQDLRENFVGEVVDMCDQSMLDRNSRGAGTTERSSPFVHETISDHAPKYNRAARRLSFGNSSHLNFPVADETNTKFGLDYSKELGADFSEYNWNSSRFKPQREPSKPNLMDKLTQTFNDTPHKDKDLSSSGETPLKKAMHSAELQDGSPWTIEFLNRIKEKRKMRQQCQPYDHSGSQGNINKVTKRRSPSILDYYRYQGGSTPKKAAVQKRHKQQAHQPVKEKFSGFFPSWTPPDKKARQTLSFATSGAGSQTKLVWKDDISCIQGYRYSKYSV